MAFFRLTCKSNNIFIHDASGTFGQTKWYYEIVKNFQINAGLAVEHHRVVIDFQLICTCKSFFETSSLRLGLACRMSFIGLGKRNADFIAERKKLHSLKYFNANYLKKDLLGKRLQKFSESIHFILLHGWCTQKSIFPCLSLIIVPHNS